MVGMATFILGLLIAGFGQDIFSHTSAGANTFSRSLVGHKAFMELLKQYDVAVVVSKNSRSCGANQAFPLLLLEPIDILESKYALDDAGSVLADKNQQEVYANRIDPVLESGAKVVVALPKRSVGVSDMAAGWIGSEQPIKPEIVQRMLSDVLLGARCISEQTLSDIVVREQNPRQFSAQALGMNSVSIEVDGSIQLIGDLPGSTPIVFSDQGTLVASLKCGIVLVSDPDLFNNRSLAKGDNAAVMLALLTKYLGAQGVVVDETLHGFDTPKSLVAYATAFPLILVSIHFLLTILLAFWAMGGYFGKPLPVKPAINRGKDLLVDNTARLLLDGAHIQDALRRYSLMVMARVAKAFGVSPKIDSLQELSVNRGVRVDLARLRLRCQAPGLTQADIVGLARQFHHWARAVQGYVDVPVEHREKRGS